MDHAIEESKSRMTKSQLQELQQAMDMGNRKRLNSILQCRQPSSLSVTPNVVLLESTPGGKYIQDMFTSNLVTDRERQQQQPENTNSTPKDRSDPTSRKEGASWSMIDSLRGLLMIDPRYKTPWVGVECVVDHLDHLDSNQRVYCVSIVEGFCNDIIQSNLTTTNGPSPGDSTSPTKRRIHNNLPVDISQNNNNDGDDNTLAFFLKHLSEMVIRTIMGETTTTQHNDDNDRSMDELERRTIGLDLMCSILRTSHHVMGETWFQRTISPMLFLTCDGQENHHQPRISQNIGTYLRLLLRYEPFLPWDAGRVIRAVISRELARGDDCQIPKGVICVDFVDSCLQLSHDDEREEQTTGWIHILVQLLEWSLLEQSCHVELSCQFFECVRVMTVNVQSALIHTLKRVDWTCSRPETAVSLWMIMYRAIGGGSLYSMMDWVPKSLRRDGLSPQEAKMLIRTQILDAIMPQDLFDAVMGEIDMEQLRPLKDDPCFLFKVFESVTYNFHNNAFEFDNGCSWPAAMKMEQVIRGAVSLPTHNSSTTAVANETTFGFKRQSICFIEAVFDIFRLSQKEEHARATLCALVAIPVAYFAAPCCRKDIVGLMSGLMKQKSPTKTVTEQLCSDLCIACIGEIVRAASVEGNDMEGLISPLCTLLDWQSRNMVTQNHLVLLLISLPLARRETVKNAKRLLDRAYVTRWLDSTDGNHPPGELHTKTGLRYLLEIIRRPFWDEVTVLAWGLLSGCIVENRPPLSDPVRVWLFEEIHDQAVTGELSNKALHHLTRVAIVRIASCLRCSESDKNIRFAVESVTPGRGETEYNAHAQQQGLDFVALLRLLKVLLCVQCQDTSDHIDRLDLYTKGLHSILLMVMSYKDDITSPTLTRLKDFATTEFGDHPCDDVFADFALGSFCILACIADWLLTLPYSIVNEQDESRFLEIPAMQSVLKRIVSQERDEVNLISSSTPPSWTGSQGSVLVDRNHDIEVDLEMITGTASSMYDVLLEFLCSPQTPNRKLLPHIRPMSKEVVMAVSHVTQVKTLFFKEVYDKNEHEPILDRSTLQDTICEFLYSASLALEKAISEQDVHNDILILLQATMQYCNVFHDTLMSTRGQSLLVALAPCWAVYLAIGSDRGCRELIKILSRSDHSRLHNGALITDHSSSSEKAGESETNITSIVGKAQISIVESLSSCFPLRITAKIGETRNENDAIGCLQIDFLDQSSATPFLLSVAQALSQDISTGINRSGKAFSSDLFLALITALEHTLIFLYETVARTTKLECRTLLTVLTGVARTIGDITNNFPFQKGDLFRACYIMAVIELPALCRDILWTGLLSKQVDEGSVQQIFRLNQDLFNDSMIKLTDVLRCWATLRKPETIPWEDIVGQHHSSPTNSMEAHDNVLKSERSVFPSPSKRTTTGRQQPADFVRLRSKELWSWSTSCSFAALEEKWLQPIREPVMSRMFSNAVGHLDDNLLPFYKERKQDLLASLSFLEPFFTSSFPTRNQIHDENAILEIMANNLPSACKARLCSLVVTISHVLCHAVKSMIESTVASTLENLHDSWESSCCVVAWCQIPHTSVDFVTGIVGWMSLLERHESQGKKQKSKQNESAAVRKVLSTATMALHDLLIDMERLGKKLSACTPGEMLAVVAPLETLVPGGVNSFHKSVVKKLDIMRRSLQRNTSTCTALPDFPEATKPKSKRAKTATTTSRARKVLRTRNKVVNAFHRLDESLETSLADTFADLEEFIVEG